MRKGSVECPSKVLCLITYAEVRRSATLISMHALSMWPSHIGSVGTVRYALFPLRWRCICNVRVPSLYFKPFSI